MAVFRSILFPVDFSERCRFAAPFVKMIAARCHANLTVMHVIEPPVSVYSTIGHDIMLDLPAMRHAARDQLETFVQAGLAGVPLRTVVEEGRAASSIAHFADEHGIDLVMMPTHGYGPFRRTLLGSVTAKVLHDAFCPVWTDAHVELPSATAQLDCKSILCAVDLDAKNIPLIRRAAGLGREFDATVRLVHAISEAESLPENHFELEHRRFLFERARDELRRMQADAGTAFDVCMEGGSVAKVVRAAAEHHQADLVIIGRGAIQEPLGRLRTNTYVVIRESICPVLSW
jgi:nucleotide-binding universal stress UspA family protein